MSVSTLPVRVTRHSSPDLAPAPASPTPLTLILVAPEWATEECQPIVRRAHAQGNAIYIVRTPDQATPDTATGMWHTVAEIDAAADAAALDHPEIPLVLIGHCDEEAAALVTVYAETHPSLFAGVVIARRRRGMPCY